VSVVVVPYAQNRFAISSSPFDIDHNPFTGVSKDMTQPAINEQCTTPDGQLGNPDGLFVPAEHVPISIDEMMAYKAFLMGLPKSCAHIPLSRDRMMMCMETYHGWGISTWEASTIYASISGTEAVVPTERTLTLVRDAFRTIWGYADDDGTTEPSQAQDLYKACKAITGALEAAEPRNALVRAWVEKPKLQLSPPLAKALAGVAGLKHYPARQKMLKIYPEYDELPLAAYNNAPHRSADDGPKKHLEQHARDLLRQLATLDLVLRGTTGVDPSLDPATIVEATFANAAALATAIADSRKQAVDTKFETKKKEPPLLTKEDLSALQARNTITKALTEARKWDRSRARGARPNHKPYERRGKGKGKGGGKGKGPRRFPASRSGEDDA
jgi:nucleoside 2-deoxyribosyltransferase